MAHPYLNCFFVLGLKLFVCFKYDCFNFCLPLSTACRSTLNNIVFYQLPFLHTHKMLHRQKADWHTAKHRNITLQAKASAQTWYKPLIHFLNYTQNSIFLSHTPIYRTRLLFSLFIFLCLTHAYTHRHTSPPIAPSVIITQSSINFAASGFPSPSDCSCLSS